MKTTNTKFLSGLFSKQEIVLNSVKDTAYTDTIPREDFISPDFDMDFETATSDALLILSTPRSGSTLLCDILRLADICVAHEYFQHFQYMPILAKRWHCVSGNKLDKNKYVAQLLRFRTNKNGWFGLNLHGEHLPNFLKAEALFLGINRHYLHILRRDTLAQAVSYEIAAQTNQWSSNFKFSSSANYSYKGILDKLNRINQQTNLISAYVEARDISCTRVYYEDLIADPGHVIRNLSFLPDFNELQLGSSLSKQSSSQNTEWRKRFANDHLKSLSR